MFCEKCGAKLPDTASFCNKCGNVLRKEVNAKQESSLKLQKNVVGSNTNVKKPLKTKNGKGFIGIVVIALLFIIGIIVVTGISSSKKKRNMDSDATGNFVEDFVEDALDSVQIISLYGTWTDSYGAVSFTFQKDGKIRISGLEDALGVDVFTFTEVDDDTLQLKAESDNPILGAVGVNLDYEITGDTMTVSIVGKTLKLVKKD